MKKSFEFTKKFTGSKEYERLKGIPDAKERIAEIRKLEIRQIYGANFSTKKPQVVFLSNLKMAFDKCNKRLPTICHDNRMLKLNLNFCSKKKTARMSKSLTSQSMSTNRWRLSNQNKNSKQSTKILSLKTSKLQKIN